MKYRVQESALKRDYAVLAVDPESGNDSAMLAVFNNIDSANRLVARMNFLEQLFDQCDCAGPDTSIKV